MKIFTMKKVLIIMTTIAAGLYSCKKEDTTPKAATELYYTAYADSFVGKVDLKLGNTIFVEGVKSGILKGEVLGLALNSKTGDMYLTMENTNGPIYKITNSGVVSILFNGPEAARPAGITYNTTNNKLYWQNRTGGTIYSLNADGSGTPFSLFGGGDVNGNGYSIKLDEKNGKLYYANFSKIYVGNLDGSGTPTILYDNISDTLEHPSSIVLDVSNNRIYYTDETTDVVASANLDGTGNFKILYNNALHGVNRSDGLAIDFVTGKIYWSESNSERIRVGNLDGSGTPTTLVNGVESYNVILK